MKARKFLLMVLCIVFLGACLSGCGTLKGLTSGVQDDWETAKRWDKNFRENWW